MTEPACSDILSRTPIVDDDPTAPAVGWDLLERWRETEEYPDGGDDQDQPSEVAAPRRRLLKLVSLTMLVATLAGVAAWLGWARVQSDRLATARTEATRSAVLVATKMAGYSYQSLTTDFADVEKASTPSFAATFEKQSSSLVSILKKYKATSSGKVSDAAVEKWSTSRAEVLVIVDQTVKNSTTANPSPQENGLLLTMVHQHGRWLLDSVSVK